MKKTTKLLSLILIMAVFAMSVMGCAGTKKNSGSESKAAGETTTAAAGTVKESETQAKTEAETEKETAAKTEAETEKATEAKTEAGSENATEAQTEAETERQTEAQTEAESENVTEAQTEAGSDDAAEAQSETEAEADDTAEAQSETEEASEDAAEAQSETAEEAEGTEEESEDASAEAVPGGEINIGVLVGPTGMGAVKLMDDAENGVYPNYRFTLTPDVTDIVARLSNGDLDIGALPTNVAANLYNKTNGGVQLIALNCLGVLYILENGDTVHSVEDLKGKTIYTLGRGSNPEFMINYVLTKAGLTPGEDVTIEFEDASAVAAKMISGDIDLCMLPVPAVTTILMKNENVRKAVDMTEAYDKAAADGSTLTMGCLVARTSFIEKHQDEVDAFLEVYEQSVGEVLADIDASAALVEKYGITGNAQIAKNALPDASIVCIRGKELRPSVEGYFQVLFDADPVSVGGAMPGDDFYYGSQE